MRRRIRYLALPALALVGCVALAGQGTQVPVAQSVAASAAGTAPSFGYRVVPENERPPTPEQRLEASLYELRADVDESRGDLQPTRLFGFDAEGLDEEVGDIVDELDDRLTVSVHVRDLSSHASLFDYYGDRPLNPASNHKIVTSSAALDLLGPDFRWRTNFRVHDDVLYVEGHGDPSLDGERLTDVAAQLAQSVSIASLDRIVVDDSAFSKRKIGPGFSHNGVGYAYQAPSSALSLAFNTVQVTVFPVSGFARAGVAVYPPSTNVVVENRAWVGGDKTRLSIRSEARGDQTVVHVSGRMASNATPTIERRRVHDAALYTGGALAAMLAEASGTQPLPVDRGRAPDGEADFAIAHDSSPLLEVVDDGLAWSNNFIAEQLLRTVGARTSGEPGNWHNGSMALEQYWRLYGNDPAELSFENGSGLSTKGRLTSRGMTSLLASTYRIQADDEGLIAALPVAGQDGTLMRRLRDSDGRVRAKTGTLRGVSALSGVVTREDGSPQVAFSILVNVNQGTVAAARRRATEDEIVRSLIRHLDAAQELDPSTVDRS
jgi:D-alanyl-D-alanine carboxypeptidase/D-alanyl-D-alanine-endopeptidase (penicillin-binding protein 4)